MVKKISHAVRTIFQARGVLSGDPETMVATFNMANLFDTIFSAVYVFARRCVDTVRFEEFAALELASNLCAVALVAEYRLG